MNTISGTNKDLPKLLRACGTADHAILTKQNIIFNAAADELEKNRQNIVLLRAVVFALQWGFNHARCPLCAGFENDERGERDHYHNATCPVKDVLELTQ